MDNPKPDATTNVPVPESPELAAERQRRLTRELMHQDDEPPKDSNERQERDDDAKR